MIRTEFLELDRLITSSKPVARVGPAARSESIQKIDARRRSFLYALPMPAAKRWSLIWLIAVPVVVGTIAGFVMGWRTPPRYRSQAVITVVPPRLDADYARPSTSASLEERLRTLEQPILSRTRLERLIRDFNLYEPELRTMIMEDVVEMFRKNIQVRTDAPGRAGDTFTIAFTGSSPLVTMKVTEKLASFFIEESMRDAEKLAEGTMSYLAAQSEDVGRRLDEASRAPNQDRGSITAKLRLEVLQSTYMKVMTNLEDARMRVNLENRQLGERFTLIDQARLPEKPLNPTRAQAATVGALGGLALGLVLAAFAANSRLLADRRAAGDAVEGI